MFRVPSLPTGTTLLFPLPFPTPTREGVRGRGRKGLRMAEVGEEIELSVMMLSVSVSKKLHSQSLYLRVFPLYSVV